MPQRRKLSSTQLRPKDRDLKDPRREEREEEITPSVSVRYCFECIEKHLQKAHGLMGEARDFGKEENIGIEGNTLGLHRRI